VSIASSIAVLAGVASMLAAGLGVTLLAPQHRRRAARITALAAWATFGLAATADFAALLEGQRAIGMGRLTLPLGLGHLELATLINPLTLIVFTLVAFVGSIVVRYSNSYLRGEPREIVFYRWLALTLGLFLLLIVSDNLWVFWLSFVATSLTLHRLLLYYPERPVAVAAARKNFLLARLADATLLVAFVILARDTHASSFTGVVRWLHAGHPVGPLLEVAAGLVAITAIVKSGVFPFHGWLIQVMEAPTQVSALLHAGLIYTGAFIVLRLSWLIAAVPWVWVLLGLAVLGVAVSSLMMTAETNIKESLAYSTSAQLAFMMMECGLGLYSVAVLHIVAHSLYKAHAFLSSGSVVDVHRGAVLTKQTHSPGLVHIELTLVLAAVETFLVATLFRVRLSTDPTLVAVGFVVTVAAGQLLLGGFAHGERTRRLLGRLVGLSLLITVAYFALHALATSVLGSTIPPESLQAARIPVWMTALVIATFLALFHLQSLLERINRTGWGAALYVAICNGLWVDLALSQLPWLDPFRRRPTTAHAAHPVRTANTQELPEFPDDHLEQAAARACDRVAPLWPLRHFVAVNPFFGIRDMEFWEADRYVASFVGTGLTMPLAYYRERFHEGRFGRADIEQALAELRAPFDVHEVLRALENDLDTTLPRIPTATDALAAHDRHDWSALTTERLSHFFATYFDEGQATWHLPWAHASLWEAWRSWVRYDLTPRIVGLGRLDVDRLPADAHQALAWATEVLQVPRDLLEDYFVAALTSVNGWASWARYLRWQAELVGSSDTSLTELLAVRVGADALAWLAKGDTELLEEWHLALRAAVAMRSEQQRITPASVIHTAFEIGYRRNVERSLRTTRTEAKTPRRPLAQLAFCIDVRSELLRRSLEQVSADVQTIGFAGFFGVQMEFVPFGTDTPKRHLPVIFNPPYRVREDLVDADEQERTREAERRRHRLRAQQAWKTFKTSAASTFTFVESVGLLYAPKLFGDAMGLSRTVPHPDRKGLRESTSRRLRPRLTPLGTPSASDGIPETKLAEIGAFILTNMGLTEGFAPLVVFVGHGATTVNNPQGTGLDCGACGGQTGEASARVAAALLNDPRTRTGLAQRGIVIPDDTVFVAALHDTVTDEVKLYDVEELPDEHRQLTERLARWLDEAGERSRIARGAALGLTTDDATAIEREVHRRTHDWAEVRPEWGLAGNAAFIAAPRARTLGIDLAARAFLHEYDWRRDLDFSTLELIMTAPMVVANWINMQYYGSMVNNERFGSGNKVLHNVVGGSIGVLEGNGGDLRIGLAMQSLHDGTRWMHEPIRLHVFLEAPREAIDRIIAAHQLVAELVTNGWVHLFQIDETGTIFRRDADGTWASEEGASYPAASLAGEPSATMTGTDSQAV